MRHELLVGWCSFVRSSTAVGYSNRIKVETNYVKYEYHMNERTNIRAGKMSRNLKWLLELIIFVNRAVCQYQLDNYYDCLCAYVCTSFEEASTMQLQLWFTAIHSLQTDDKYKRMLYDFFSILSCSCFGISIYIYWQRRRRQRRHGQLGRLNGVIRWNRSDLSWEWKRIRYRSTLQKRSVFQCKSYISYIIRPIFWLISTDISCELCTHAINMIRVQKFSYMYLKYTHSCRTSTWRIYIWIDRTLKNTYLNNAEYEYQLATF